jgi:hypothetical protein
MIRLFTVASMMATLLVVAAPVAEAHHRPNFYCGESGDLCQSTRKVENMRKLAILTYAKYFSRYRLCVTGPDGLRSCKTFRMRETPSGFYEGKVKWRRHFPDSGPGTYVVTWRALGQRIEKLGFHAR